MEKFISTYRNLAAIPQIGNAEFLPYTMKEDSQFGLQINWICRDLGKMEKQKVSENIFVSSDSVLQLPCGKSAEDVVLQRRSPKGDKEALVIQNDSIQQLIVMGNDYKQRTFNLQDSNLHGKVYHDPYISSLEWSLDETHLVFLAEEKRSVGKGFFENYNKGEGTVGSKHLFIEDWGEQMIGQHQSVVVTICVCTGKQRVYPLEEGLTAGEVQFVPKTNEIIGVACSSKPFRLGRAYSSDRESFIFHLRENGTYVELTPRNKHVERIRFSPDGSKLVYFQSDTFGPVAPTLQICLMDWNFRKCVLILDYVPTRMRLADGQEFRGVCPKTVLPMRCWDTTSSRIYFSALDMNTYSLYEMDISTRNIRRYSRRPSTIFLDVFDDRCLVKQSSVTEPDRLFWAALPASKDFFYPMLRPLTKELSLRNMTAHSYDIWQFKSDAKRVGAESVEFDISAMYIGPTENLEGEPKRPLILWPHGGPHSIRPNAFDHMFAFFVSLGYSILLPNYRGSSGMGREVLTCCVGHCGVDDVSDCNRTLDLCLARFADVVNPKCIYGIGLSHGGFLTAHLSSKFPDLFNATCLMNPATDIPTMASASDIPEWAFLEFGHAYCVGTAVNADAAQRMHERSPVTYIDKVRSPTLVLLGNQDRRVPVSQGLNYHRLLLARNIPTQVFMYDDNHPLLKLSSESDGLIQMALWFHKYSKQSGNSY